MDNLELMRLSEMQDVEAFDSADFEEESLSSTKSFKKEYSDFYNDVKQSCKYIKEDW